MHMSLVHGTAIQRVECLGLQCSPSEARCCQVPYYSTHGTLHEMKAFTIQWCRALARPERNERY